jgi:D-glycero-D-manno-heptose 1,7-bisphosphate phosphatase
MTLTPMSSLRPAVFFDRDGVLNHDVGFAHRPDQITWIDGAVAAVTKLNQLNFLVFVVTNQSGIARGLYTEANVTALHTWMTADMADQGARIDAFQYCPHFPEGSVATYSQICTCRKPAPGMILSLMSMWPVDRGKSFLIGDRDTDIAAATAAGIRGLLFPGGNLLRFVDQVLDSTASRTA